MPRIANFPKPPGRGAKNTDAFPNDLVNGSREFYTELALMNYSWSNGVAGGIMSGIGGSIRLPMPRRIFENESLLWEEWSGTQTFIQAMQSMSPGGMLGAGIEAGASLYSITNGKSLNPWQFMMFKRPTFKEFSFQWSLAPNTQEESETIRRIVNNLKRAALPTPAGPFLMDYPQVAQVSFRPNKYLFKLKPCAIISVQVDYTGAGQASFFKSGAPTIVNLSLQLKEIELWNTANYQE